MSDTLKRVDEIIASIENGGFPTIEDIIFITSKAKEIFLTLPNVIKVNPPVTVCGDIHGQFCDLQELFKIIGPLPYTDYLFMGDYVDRGFHSLNTYLLLVTLKIEYPHQISLLRGNHESRQISHTYGFYNEIVANYGHAGLWNLCNDSFDLLPIAAIVDSDIFCVHGGLSPHLPLVERISLIKRQQEIPSDGPFADLVWSDPEEKARNYRQNTRGAGFLFGRDQCAAFNRVNRLRMICRSHQLAMKGYQKYFGESNKSPDWRLITVWSAPDYTYRSNNLASVMHVYDDDPKFSEDYPYHLTIFDKSDDRKEPDKKERPVISFYFT